MLIVQLKKNFASYVQYIVEKPHHAILQPTSSKYVNMIT